MANIRRKFIQAAAIATGATLLSGWKLTAAASLRTQRRVVIVGGGFAGATAAHYLRMWDQDIKVIMIEQQPVFVSCPQSNLVFSGSRTIQRLTRSYQRLSELGVQIVQATVTAVDSEHKLVRLNDGAQIYYDRLILAPGIEFIYDKLPMLTPEIVSTKIPHAWKAGAQTELLYRQLQAMRQGGRVVITIPSGPFRCPPGPYERACQIALFLKQHNPNGKLIIFDANDDLISKKALFLGAWERSYADFIEYYPSNDVDEIDVNSMTVEGLFDRVTADVLNVIPPQKAGKIAEMAGVINVDKLWCRVDFRSYESTAVSHIHVIGDAVASKLPKSAHIANSQAKVCVAAIIALFNEQPVEQMPVFSNTCYSFVDANKAGHVAAVYRYDSVQDDMVAMFGAGASVEATEREGMFAEAWAHNIWADSLG